MDDEQHGDRDHIAPKLALQVFLAIAGWLVIGLVAEITTIWFSDVRATTTSSGAAALAVLVIGGLALRVFANSASAKSGALVALVSSLAVYALWFRGFEVTFVEGIEDLFLYEIHDGSVQAFIHPSPRFHWAVRSALLGLGVGLLWAITRQHNLVRSQEPALV